MIRSTTNLNPERGRLDPVLLWILFGAAARVIPHPPNFAPIAAMALFGGAYLGPRLALVAPLAAMLLSDLILGAVMGFAAFSWMTPFIYGAFAAIGLAGIGLRRTGQSSHAGWIAGATLASSLGFFIVTNFGVWAVGSLYPHNPEGLMACYAAAIPFFRNTILGDVFWVAVMFGSYGLLRRWILSRNGRAAHPGTPRIR